MLRGLALILVYDSKQVARYQMTHVVGEWLEIDGGETGIGIYYFVHVTLIEG